MAPFCTAFAVPSCAVNLLKSCLLLAIMMMIAGYGATCSFWVAEEIPSVGAAIHSLKVLILGGVSAPGRASVTLLVAARLPVNFVNCGSQVANRVNQAKSPPANPPRRQIPPFLSRSCTRMTLGPRCRSFFNPASPPHNHTTAHCTSLQTCASPDSWPLHARALLLLAFPVSHLP